MLKKLDWNKYVLFIAPLYGFIPMVIYLTYNTIVFSGSRLITNSFYHHNIYSSLDAKIPYIPEWMYMYVFAFVTWAIGFTLIAREERKICYPFFTAELLAKTITLFIFFIYPTVMPEPNVPTTGFLGWFNHFILGFDEPNNLFPSIHCLESWIIFRGSFMCKRTGWKFKVFSFVAAIFVFISVLLVKQHVIIDIFGGIAVVEIALFLTKKYNLGRFYFAFERKLSGKNYEGK